MQDINIIIKTLREAGIHVFLDNGKLKTKSLKGTLSPDLISLIKKNKDQIIEKIKTNSLAHKNSALKRTVINKVNRSNIKLKSSYAQQSLWLIDKMDGGSVHYNLPLVLDTRGDFKLTIAQQVFTQIIQRHEPLRTVFAESDNGPLQIIREQFDFYITQIDLRDLNTSAQKIAIDTAVEGDAKQPFNLSDDLMLRVSYLQIANNQGLMLFNMHHIAADGWSIEILLDEFVEIYHSILEGRTPSLKPLMIQYADYAHWQHNNLSGKVLESQLGYWEKKLADLPQIHALPLDFERPKFQTFNGALHHFKVDSDTLKRLKNIALENQATLFMVIHAAFSILLSRYSNNSDIVIGTPVANRIQKGLEPLIGYFVNTLVLRADCSNNPKFLEFLEQIKRTNLDAQTNQDTPFEHLVDRLNPSRSTSHNALFQIMFSMDKSEGFELVLPKVSLTSQPRTQITVKFDLEMNAVVIDDGGTDPSLQCSFEYNSSLFELNTIKHLAKSLGCLLEALAEDPTQKIAELPLLGTKETQYLLYTLNDAQLDCSSDLCLHQLFERQVDKTPDKTAIVFEQQSLTYTELNKHANQLAHYLIEKGVIAEDLVGICFDRSLDMIISLMAILKAGAAYLPLDPNYPQQRLKYMMADSGVTIVLSHQKTNTLLDIQRKVLLDKAEIQTLLAEYPVTNPPLGAISPKNLAYVIYTSGSTGQPKGVLIEHQSISQHILSVIDVFLFNQNDRFLQFASINFDTFAEQTFSALAIGATLHITGKQLLSNEEFYTYTDSNKITVTDLSPSYLSTLLNSNASNYWQNTSLTRLVVGGDSLPKGIVQRWFDLSVDKRCQLFNAYGPTEATITTTVKEVTQLESSVSIGYPLPGRKIFILDSQLNLSPFGSIGELYIGGYGLARGYLNQPKLTAERFISNPFTKKTDECLYRTGDLVRYLKDGQLAFIGRVDDQVKIRGFRIELGEIEQQLSLHEAVQTCAVIAEEDSLGHKHKCLVAYITHDTQRSDADIIIEIRSHLQLSLPNYMLPSVLIVLESLPLMPNGKIDRKALPKPSAGISDGGKEPFQAAASKVEITLSHIWSKLLNIPQSELSTNANFFTLGGDSILSIQVVSRALEAGLKVSIKQIFEHQSIQSLAPHVVTSVLKVSQESVNGTMPLLPIQHNFFNDDTVLNHYNQAVLLKTPADFSPELLASIIEQLYLRHDALRLRFAKKNDQWQAQHKTFSPQMLSESLGELILEIEGFETLKKQANTYQTSLSLADGPLFKAVHCRDCNGQTRLLLIIHHLVVDGVSWRILIDDIKRLYQQHSDGDSLILAAKSSSYQCWGDFLLEYSQSQSLLAEKAYWRSVLAAPVVDFHQKSDSNSEVDSHFSSTKFSLDELTTTQLLMDAQKAYRTQINELLLSALLLGFHRWSGENSIRIDLEGHGREELSKDIDLSQSVGWFTSLFPLNISSESMEFEALICAVKEQYRAVPNQGIGFGVLKELTQAEGLCGAEVSPILFNYLGQISHKESGEGFSFADENIGDLVSPLRQPEHALNFNGSVTDGCLVFTVDYRQSIYEADAIKQLLIHIKQAIISLVSHCLKPDSGCLTPVDFPLAQINQEQLNQWQKDYKIEDIYPATAMQQGLLFHTALDKSAYLTQLIFTLEPGVNIEAFHQAWQQVLNRHNILRTVFVASTSGDLQQLVLKEVKLPWTESDLTSLNEEAQWQRIESERHADKAQGFEIDQGPLMRIRIWHVGNGRYHVLLSDHHALTDGWSIPLIFSEVTKYYQAAITGENLQIKPAVPYRHYIQWLAQQDFEKATSFWRQELVGIEGPTLISEKQHSDQKKQVAWQLLINEKSTNKLQQLAKDSKVTVNSLLQAAWSYLLSRYSNQNTVVFGTTVSGRPAQLKNVERMVGLFINTIPVRVDIPFKMPFKQWLETLHAKQIERNEYSYLPLVEIQKLASCSRDVQLIDNLFVFENYPFDDSSTNTQQEQPLIISNHVGYEETNYTLSINASVSNELAINFAGKSSHFSQQSLEQLSQNFKTVLMGIIENPMQPIEKLPLLNTQQQMHLLNGVNKTVCQYPKHLCLHQVFEQQVEKIPENVAVFFEGKVLSYVELNAKANQLAHYLNSLGLKPDDLVGLCIERSIEMIIALLAILKAGAAYLPLDPAYPKERLQFMFTDSNIKYLLTHKHVCDVIDGDSKKYICLDSKYIENELKKYPDTNLLLKDLKPSHLAYVIYTSGSTGQPKGVLLEHSGVVNLFYAQQKHFSVTHDSKVLQFASISFDAATFEWIMALLSGACLYICDEHIRKDTDQLEDYLRKNAITHATLPPALLKLLNCNDSYSFESLVVAGEAFDQQLSQQWGAIYNFFNAYGPTEISVCASISEPLHAQYLNIGKSINNMQLYVLDNEKRLLPKGCIGELYIGGVGLARGYLNRPELTYQQFIDNPFNQQSSKRLYRTGDLVRYLEDDNLEFIGRIDDQVKIRGYRIEIGEIEHQLSLHEKVETCVVIARENSTGDKYLAAYITHDSNEVNADIIADVRSHLQLVLPNYMVPSQFMVLTSLPLNSNGKIDRKALPDCFEALPQSVNFVEPEGETELALCRTWAELLNLPINKISTTDNFFDRGGDSLMAIKQVTKINFYFQLNLNIQTIFEAGTLSELAKHIDALKSRSSINDSTQINNRESFEI